MEEPISVQSDVKKQLFEDRYFFWRKKGSQSKNQLVHIITTVTTRIPAQCCIFYWDYLRSLKCFSTITESTITIVYQDNQFDLPDRTFHSREIDYRLASHDSATDVKEITVKIQYERVCYFANFLEILYKWKKVFGKFFSWNSLWKSFRWKNVLLYNQM